MEQFKWLVLVGAALIPLVTGFIWYSKPVFGNTWMRINRFHEPDMKGGNMILTFILTYVFSFMLAVALSSIVIHQMALFSVIGGEAKNAADKQWLEQTMQAYGHNFRTFKHGLLHGTMSSVFFALPVIGIVAMFERRGWKYVLIHLGYWFVTLGLMGGVICQWL
jgi:hypothetical protein